MFPTFPRNSRVPLIPRGSNGDVVDGRYLLETGWRGWINTLLSGMKSHIFITSLFPNLQIWIPIKEDWILVS